MIPRDLIAGWRSEAPWIQDAQVEQDLILSRSLVELFSVAEIREAIAFRGGMARGKLRLRPAVRYSEDIDLRSRRVRSATSRMRCGRGWMGGLVSPVGHSRKLASHPLARVGAAGHARQPSAVAGLT